MERWSIVDGPRPIDQPAGGDWDIGWVWTIAHDRERRAVVVYIAGGRLETEQLPEESQRAIATSGQSAVADVLHEESPPERLVVTSSGISRR